MSAAYYRILTPGPGKVVVKRDPDPEKTKGGIYYPDKDKEPAQTGTIMAVSLQWETDYGTTREMPAGVQIGAKIAFGKYAGFDLPINDEDFIILKADDILVVLDPVYDPAQTVR